VTDSPRSFKVALRLGGLGTVFARRRPNPPRGRLEGGCRGGGRNSTRRGKKVHGTSHTKRRRAKMTEHKTVKEDGAKGTTRKRKRNGEKDK